MPLTPSERAAIVDLTLVAARALQRSNLSVDEVMARGSKELATFLLGVMRVMEALGTDETSRWEREVSQRLGRDLIELQRLTGTPTFMDPAFLDFVKELD